MLKISIDGACRRNGKPDCVAAGGVYIIRVDENGEYLNSTVRTIHEVGSTNQRGELLALLAALDYIYTSGFDGVLITDSEYLFNIMTKDWITNWERKDWLTASGNQVKNKDIMLALLHASRQCSRNNIEVVYYHIKGHCIPFGKVTAEKLLLMDNTGKLLYDKIAEKYDTVCTTSKADNLLAANKLSVKNNGFELTNERLKDFVVMNIVADTVATYKVEQADAAFKKTQDE